jgi:hypothetical protein
MSRQLNGLPVFVVYGDERLESFDEEDLHDAGLMRIPPVDAAEIVPMVPFARINDSLVAEIAYIREHRTPEEQLAIVDTFARIGTDLLEYQFPFHEAAGALQKELVASIKEKVVAETDTKQQATTPPQDKRQSGPANNKQIQGPPQNKSNAQAGKGTGTRK